MKRTIDFMNRRAENGFKQCHCARLRKDTGTGGTGLETGHRPKGAAPSKGFAMRNTQQHAGQFCDAGPFAFLALQMRAEMKIQSREMVIDTRTAQAESRTVAVSVSSDFPADRGDYTEILLHDAKAIDLSRAPLPLIESHDAGKVNVGIVEGLRTDGRKLRGTLRMGASQRATELWADIVSGVVRGISVGYEIVSYTTKANAVTVTRWKPFEVSICACPLDISVGINRSHTFSSNNLEHKTMNTENIDLAMQGRAAKNSTEMQLRELQRRDDLRGYGESFREYGGEDIAKRLIENGGSTDLLKSLVLEQMQSRMKPLSLAEPDYSSPLSNNIETPRASTHYDPSRPFAGQGGEQRAHRFGMWVKGSVLGDKRAQDWCRDHGVRAMSGGSLSSGGATVPQEFASEFIFLAEQYGVARKSMRRWVMSTDQLMIPRRDGGPTAYFIGEGTEITASDQSWGQIGLHAKTLATLIRVGNNLLEDNVVNLGSVLAQDVALAFATKEDTVAFTGAGDSSSGGITGIKTKLDAASTFKSYVTATTGHNLMGEIDATDLSKLMGRLPAYARPNAKFYCSQAAVSEIFERIMATSGGNTILSMSDRPVLRYMGHEVVVTQAMPNDGTADLTASTMILFGDLSMAAAFGDRRNIELRQDPSRYLEFLQTAIVASERFDVVVHDIGSASLAGPIVGLVGN
jgi:HK97 family phage major capsid protein